MLMESIALRTNPNPHTNSSIIDDLNMIRSRLYAFLSSTASDISYDGYFYPCDKIEVQQQQRQRHLLLVERMNQLDEALREEKYVMSQTNLKTNYERRSSHQTVYESDWSTADNQWTLTEEFRLLNHIIQNDLNDDKSEIPSPDSDNNGSVIEISSLLHEPLRNIFTFNIFSPSYCRMIYEELLHYEVIASSQPCLGLPLDVRHDGNWGNLQNCGFTNLLVSISSLIQPIVRMKYPHLGMSSHHSHRIKLI
jgi:hypothetical protein